MSMKYSYQREYFPGIVPFDLLRVQLPDAGVDGDLRVVTQSIVLTQGIEVGETAGIEVVA